MARFPQVAIRTHTAKVYLLGKITVSRTSGVYIKNTYVPFMIFVCQKYAACRENPKQNKRDDIIKGVQDPMPRMNTTYKKVPRQFVYALSQ